MFIFNFIIIISDEFEFDDLKYCVLISVLRFTKSTSASYHYHHKMLWIEHLIFHGQWVHEDSAS